MISAQVTIVPACTTQPWHLICPLTSNNGRRNPEPCMLWICSWRKESHASTASRWGKRSSTAAWDKPFRSHLARAWHTAMCAPGIWFQGKQRCFLRVHDTLKRNANSSTSGLLMTPLFHYHHSLSLSSLLVKSVFAIISISTYCCCCVWWHRYSFY